jgi:hypothetical protein
VRIGVPALGESAATFNELERVIVTQAFIFRYHLSHPTVSAIRFTHALFILFLVVELARTATRGAEPTNRFSILPVALASDERSRDARASVPRDYSQHIAALKRQIPGDGFHIVVQPPFVVVGDEAEAVVRQRATGTIRWAVERLMKEYFERDPAQIITIWLFRDKASYARNVKKIWGETPTTPFGYYSARHRALVMNIATGGGTLVHEIVHPFMASNFPACPAWLNEGLGSLYEQCGDRNGHIWGYTNWRLTGLQRAIRAGKVPSLRALCSTTSAEFYGVDRGINYAQARYLCY